MAINPPTTTIPGNGSSPGTLVSSLTPTFSWNQVSGATGYGLYIRDMTAVGASLIYPNARGTTTTPLTGSSFTMPAGILAAGHVYRWNMTSFIGSTESTGVSVVLYFQTPVGTTIATTVTPSTGNAPGTVAVNPPAITMPGNGRSPGTPLNSLVPIFSWHPVSGASGYGLYIRDMTAPGIPLIYPNASGTTARPLTGNSFTIPAGILTVGHVYRWNMTSFNGSTESTTVSDALYFHTPAATAPPPIATSSGNSNPTKTVTASPSPSIPSNNSTSSGKMPFDTVVGSFNGVTAYSNGSVTTDSTDRISTGLKWQCVEFVRRYYSTVYGMNIGAGENASGFYSSAASWKLASFPNGGTVSPQVGDILCFAGGSSGNGHVAIITGVSSTQITVIQQNVTESSRDAAFPYPMSVTVGKYTVSGSTLGTTYHCQGWLRRPVVSASAESKPSPTSAITQKQAVSTQSAPSGVNKTSSSPSSIGTVSSTVKPPAKPTVTPTPQVVQKLELTVQANPKNAGVVKGSERMSPVVR